jgi:hypothetical protein
MKKRFAWFGCSCSVWGAAVQMLIDEVSIRFPEQIKSLQGGTNADGNRPL